MGQNRLTRGVLILPLVLRPINRAVVGEPVPLGCLPSLEIRRPHQPFRQVNVDDLRAGSPAWAFIGDSMLGTRIDPFQLGRIPTTGNEYVAFRYPAATGPGWWCLAFKNQLIVSGVKPRMTFFFRDTNLTDTMFRLEGQYGRALDEVATQWEPGNSTPWSRSIERARGIGPIGSWVRPVRPISPLVDGTLASWNYVLWGLHHGTLVVVTRTVGTLLKLPERWPGPLAFVQTALTVTAAFVGWLFFRETNPDLLRRWLVLAPSESTVMERQVGIYLLVLAATWARRCSWTISGRSDASGAGGWSRPRRRDGWQWGHPVSAGRCCRQRRRE